MTLSMKINSAVVLALFATSLVHAASDEVDSASKALQVYPKNLARQHLGANLLVFDPAKQGYVPAEAAAAWLDDDVATGWSAPAGVQHYLVSLPEPQLLSNFCVSARSAKGTVTLYAGDEASAPSAKSWTLLAKDVSLESINGKLLDKSFSHFAKYLLIETNLPEAAPWYSVYIYGEKPAIAYHLQERSQPVDPATLFGPYSNTATAFSVSSLYAHGRVAFVNTPDTATAWQKAIDDNPETQMVVAPSQDKAGLVIRYDSARTIQRISVLSDGAPKGKFEFFLINGSAPVKPSQETGAANDESQYIKASLAVPATEGEAQGIGMTPIAAINFDGSSQRGSADFAPVTGTQLLARWTPADGNSSLPVR
ncbi:MAG: hypothetical protein QOD99_2951, partial [Chthoniobacter sp.]|nr:hypothetical protein [Chthoniobacter sp.]